MHQTNMFQRQAPQPQAPAIETFNINALAPQFQNWTFQVGAPYDQHTPQFALMTANEIQQQALSGHPIRVGMFNIISENSFNNPSFQDLIFTIVMRIGHGVSNGEFRSPEQAVNAVISRCVKSLLEFLVLPS